MPRALKASRACKRCETERANLSNRQQQSDADNIGDQMVELRAPFFGARDSSIDILASELSSPTRHVLAQLTELGLPLPR